MMKFLAILLILLSSVLAYAADAAPFIADTGTAPPLTKSDQTDTSLLTANYPSFESLFVRYQPYLKNISAYKPMYFLLGADPEETKFQISFKYRIFNTGSPLTERIPMLNGIHFAYTQTSFWDLASDSKPFEDTSYKPEFFYISPNIPIDFSNIKGFFIQTGIEHESNGLAAEDSRSTNFLYFQPILIFYNEKNRTGISVGPKVWAYVDNDKETNRDLKDYRGHFDLQLKLGKEDGLMLGSNFRWAKKGESIQLDLIYPLNKIFSDILGIYLNVQYVSSLAESLLHYDERTEALRIGLAIVR
jgi:outer membrane phospholipase A